MKNKSLKILRQANSRKESSKKKVVREALSAINAHLQSRSYRADLQLTTKSRDLRKRVTAEVRYDAELGYPTEEDLMTLVAQDLPTHEVEWDTIDVDRDMGVVYVNLEPSVEMIPVGSINDIPAEFVSIGSAMFKRAADANDNMMEIWSLKKTDGGLALYRTDNIEISADESEFRAGDVVNTPDGPGKIMRFDDGGNAFVQISHRGKNKVRLVAQNDMYDYSLDKERAKLEDYYAQAYGDAEFAKDLVTDYDED